MRYSEVKNILRGIGVTPDKTLGQSFLVNRIIAARIAAAAMPEPGENLLEIGSGIGALTSELLRVHPFVTAIEISAKMTEYLSDRYDSDQLSAVRGDFLKLEPSTLPGYPFAAVAGNLPYSVSSRVLFRLIEPVFESVCKAVLMLQKEVAIRVCTLDGGRDYGRLSLQLWPLFSVKVLLDAGPSDFYPPPRVNSRVIVLTRREKPLVDKDRYDIYRKLVRVSFSSRRKIILNNLAALYGRERASDLLSSAGIDSGLRAEEIEPEAFLRLAEKGSA